jgi:hypothetical protein
MYQHYPPDQPRYQADGTSLYCVVSLGRALGTSWTMEQGWSASVTRPRSLRARHEHTDFSPRCITVIQRLTASKPHFGCMQTGGLFERSDCLAGGVLTKENPALGDTSTRAPLICNQVQKTAAGVLV